jgi:SH3-like domain-containing protein
VHRPRRKPVSKPSRQWWPVAISVGCMAFAFGLVFAVKDQLGPRAQAFPAGEITGSTEGAAQQLGPSGLPLPRFVSLKAGKVNVRRGPSSDHPVAWVFQRKGMPVEITAEFENWRKIRDSEGAEGWILQSMLSGRRNAYVADWTKAGIVDLYDSADAASGLAARLQAGVLASIESCDGRWCAIEAEGHAGFADQSLLWGVYPGEVVN